MQTDFWSAFSLVFLREDAVYASEYSGEVVSGVTANLLRNFTYLLIGLCQILNGIGDARSMRGQIIELRGWVNCFVYLNYRFFAFVFSLYERRPGHVLQVFVFCSKKLYFFVKKVLTIDTI